MNELTNIANATTLPIPVNENSGLILQADGIYAFLCTLGIGIGLIACTKMLTDKNYAIITRLFRIAPSKPQ